MGYEKEDISRKLLFFLLVIIIFVSVLGTWITLSVIDQGDRFSMTPRVVEIKQDQPSMTTGYVAFALNPSHPPSSVSEGDTS